MMLRLVLNRFSLCLVMSAQVFSSTFADTTSTTNLPPTMFRSDPAHMGTSSQPINSPLSMLWSYTTTYDKKNTAGPVSYNGTIYFCSGNHVYALRASDGKLIWKFPTDSSSLAAFHTTPAVDESGVYVGSDNSNLYKLNPASGTEEWLYKAGGAIRSSPTLSGDLVYFGSTDSTCYAVRASTGEIQWKGITGGAIVSSPTLANNQIVVASSDNSINAFNAVSGRLLWSATLSSDSTMSPPVWTGNQLLIGCGSILYSVDNRGDARPIHDFGSDITSPVTVIGSNIYVSTQDKNLSAINSHGTILWSIALAYPCDAPPINAGGTLVVPTQHGIIYAIDSQTHETIWVYVTQSVATADQPRFESTDILSAPVWADKTLYVYSDDGTLSSYRQDAVDKIAPTITDLSPVPGSPVAGVRIPYSATVFDIGSGINPKSVSMSIDTHTISIAKYNPGKNGIQTDLSQDIQGLANQPLADGFHNVSVKATDWFGNSIVKSWSFVVDNALDPPGITAPIASSIDNGGAPVPAVGTPGFAGLDAGPGLPPPPPPLDLPPANGVATASGTGGTNSLPASGVGSHPGGGVGSIIRPSGGGTGGSGIPHPPPSSGGTQPTPTPPGSVGAPGGSPAPPPPTAPGG